MSQNFIDNTLYEMDNLVVLRGMNSETVDLIATDPPFNTKRNRKDTAGFYVDNWKWGDTGILPDQWKWNEVHPKWLEGIKDDHEALYQAIDAAIHCKGEDTAAFLCFISVRLLEMHRILKPKGSIFLHCDLTASHYIKTCMDAIFGKSNFRNEIVWQRASGRAKGSQHESRTLGQDTDTIFYYSKSSKYTHNAEKRPLTEEETKEKFPLIDENRRRYNTKTPIFCSPSMGARANLCYEYKGVRNPHPSGWRMSKEKLIKKDKAGYIIWREGETPLRKAYADEYKGKPIGSLWMDIPIAAGNERTGSPDQKPIALYERIIRASSNEGDLVLDPFCGCATTIIAANNLKRRWVGIDRRKDARYHIITRLMGITRKQRKRLEKYALDKEWLDRQTQSYEMHYQTEPPTRTDKDGQESAELPQVYTVAEPENLLTHAEMHEILVDQFGLQCWGCHFQPPDKRYLHLDHITPKSEGSTNQIDNRALLCQPCNSMKSNKMSLTALRRRNKQEGYEHDNEPIDLPSALAWTRQHMINLIRSTPHQYRIDS